MKSLAWFELLGNPGIFKKNTRITQILYWQHSACIRVENVFSKYTITERVVKRFFSGPTSLANVTKGAGFGVGFNGNTVDTFWDVSAVGK